MACKTRRLVDKTGNEIKKWNIEALRKTVRFLIGKCGLVVKDFLIPPQSVAYYPVKQFYLGRLCDCKHSQDHPCGTSPSPFPFFSLSDKSVCTARIIISSRSGPHLDETNKRNLDKSQMRQTAFNCLRAPALVCCY